MTISTWLWGRQPAETRPSLAVQFVVAAGCILLVGMSIIGFWVSARIENAVIRNTAITTALYVESIISPLTQELASSDQLSEGARLALDETLKQGVFREKMFAFKIWKPDGTIVFSNEASVVGKRFSLTEGLLAARAGNVHAEFDHLEGLENEVERRSGLPLLEIYSPIREPWSGRVIAISEFYEVASELRSDLTGAKFQSWLVVGLVTFAMLALLFGIVARGSRLIAAQRSSLNEQVSTLSDLLIQNRTLRRREEQATRLTADLNERYLRRISAELHDGPAQLLAFASLRLGAVASVSASEDIDRVKTALDEAMQDIRNICRGLTLPELESLTTIDVITRVVVAHEGRTGTRVAFDCASDLPALSMADKICAYRFIQEALNNAFRHAGGLGQRVAACAKAGGIEIRVSDDGPGFDRQSAGNGLGLIGLEERIASLRGSLTIAAEQGTTLTMWLPENARS